MSISPDANLPKVHEALLRAEAELVRLLLEAAPLPEGSTKDPEYLELVTRYERYMPSKEVRAILDFFYMLTAYGVTGGGGGRPLFLAPQQRTGGRVQGTSP